MNPPRVLHLYLSPGHNYVGHRGGPSGDHPATEVDAVECVTGRGLAGDRYFGHAEDYKGQITFFAWETHLDLCAQFGADPQQKSPACYRRNVITHGMDLGAWIGCEFELQGIRFFGMEECRPCAWMDEAFCPGAHEALKGRGGLRAKILSDGVLKKSGA